MIGGRRGPKSKTALIIPDEQVWTMHGEDPISLGYRPSFRPGSSQTVVMPSRIPSRMKRSLVDWLAGRDCANLVLEQSRIAGSVDVEMLFGRNGTTASRGAAAGVHEEGGSDHGHDHGGSAGDMDDMMAITGEPSPDGLVMEDLEISYGPFGTPFPGGLSVNATLDGDVVSEVRIEGQEPGVEGEPELAVDPLTPRASERALDLSREKPVPGPAFVFEIELERARSHLAWLRSLSRLLGWQKMTRHAAGVLECLSTIEPGFDAASSAASAGRSRNSEQLEAAASAMAPLIELLSGSRLLGLRLTGRGVVPPETAAESGLSGPNLRASGISRDHRMALALYRQIGFEPLLQETGDAAARTLLRGLEAAQSIDLASKALLRGAGYEASFDNNESGQMASVEGPRGGLSAEKDKTGWHLEAAGARAAKKFAGEAMTGETWENALAILASFDLSPWAVGDR